MEPLKLDKKKRRPMFKLHPTYVETILDEKNRSLIEYTKPLVCRFFKSMWITNGVSQRHKKTNGNSLPEKQTTTHNL